MVWKIDGPQGDEAAKVRYAIVPYTRGVVLDLGCGPKRAWKHFIGVDSGKDTQLFGIEMKPDVYCDVSNPDALDATFKAGSADAVFSSHCLEHIEDYEAALRAWWALIKEGGHLCLYLPHAELYPRIGTHGANPDHKHDFLPADIVFAMRRVGSWDLLVDETRSAGDEYSFLQVYRKRGDDKQIFVCDELREKTACVVRYGAIGDLIQAAAIARALKIDGFHVTMMVESKNAPLLEADPYIDEFLLQDKDQVPNHLLPEFFEEWAPKFDRWVNLCESVEGTLLALPGRMNHQWPAAMRRKYMDHNYLEFSAEIAQVDPVDLRHHFYPTVPELERAKAVIERAGQVINPVITQEWKKPFLVMWCLAGSSKHKFYPHQDTIIARMMTDLPEAVVITSGDEATRLLERGWEEEKRVIRTAGEMPIRDTLTLAKSCHLVIGPETGVLNAVAFEPMAKIVFLSHSSRHNLTEHWLRTQSMVPPTKCYPCHQLHFDNKHCPEHEPTGAALCQWEIDPEWVWAAVKSAHQEWKEVR